MGTNGHELGGNFQGSISNFRGAKGVRVPPVVIRGPWGFAHLRRFLGGDTQVFLRTCADRFFCFVFVSAADSSGSERRGIFGREMRNGFLREAGFEPRRHEDTTGNGNAEVRRTRSWRGEILVGSSCGILVWSVASGRTEAHL